MFIFDKMKSAQLLEKALDTASLRQKIIANNITNVDVPNFKRSEVNFESELKRVIQEKESENTSIKALVTDSRHIPFSMPRDISSVNPRINFDYSTTTRNDGNNVDIEKEVVDASENQMKYNLFIQRINSFFSGIKKVMDGVR
jgi:flagellar basal-body rod protein FlgB